MALSILEYREMTKAARTPKYRAVISTLDGIKFASKKEMKRYACLKLLERAGQISDLKRQVRIALNAPNGIKIGDWIADHTYFDQRANCQIYEDVKGFSTPLYLWKKRHFEAQYNIPILEV